jgi:hypothetical protein
MTDKKQNVKNKKAAEAAFLFQPLHANAQPQRISLGGRNFLS